MSGHFAGWFIRRLMKGRSAAQIERAFWIIVLGLTVLISAASLLQVWTKSGAHGAK